MSEFNQNRPRTPSEDDWLAVYALGGLDGNDLREAQTRLAADPELRLQLQQLQETVARLPLAPPPLTPSAEMESALMARVEASAAARRQTAPPTAQPPAAAEHTRPASWLDSLRALLSPPLVTGAAFAGVVVLLGLMVFFNRQVNTLQSQVTDLRNGAVASAAEMENLTVSNDNAQATIEALRRDRQSFEGQLAQVTGSNILLEQKVTSLEAENQRLADQVAALNEANLSLAAASVDMESEIGELRKVTALFSSSEAQSYVIGGTDIIPNATAQIIFEPNSDVAVLAVSNLPPLQEGNVYQVLLIRGSEHDTAETFQVDTEGGSFLVIHAPFPFATFDTFGVSIEPAGGSVQRTGEIVLLGSILN